MFKVCSLTIIEDLLERPHTPQSPQSFEEGLMGLCQFTVFSKLLETINNDEHSESLKQQLALILLNEKYDQLRSNFSQIPDNTWPHNLKIREFYETYILPNLETTEPSSKRPMH